MNEEIYTVGSRINLKLESGERIRGRIELIGYFLKNGKPEACTVIGGREYSVNDLPAKLIQTGSQLALKCLLKWNL